MDARPGDIPLLALRGVGKTYPSPGDDVHALRAVDLDLFAGELVVMLGPSGSGKSTLLHVLGGLDAPSRGVLRFRGRELSFADAARILIAQLTDPVVVRKILAHLGLPTEPPRPAPARSREQLDFA